MDSPPKYVNGAWFDKGCKSSGFYPELKEVARKIEKLGMDPAILSPAAVRELMVSSDYRKFMSWEEGGEEKEEEDEEAGTAERPTAAWPAITKAGAECKKFPKWPATTKAGTYCKKCLQKEEVFCFHHAGKCGWGQGWGDTPH